MANSHISRKVSEIVTSDPKDRFFSPGGSKLLSRLFNRPSLDISILQFLYVPFLGIFSAQTIGPVLLFPEPVTYENGCIFEVDKSASIEILTQKMLISGEQELALSLTTIKSLLYCCQPYIQILNLLVPDHKVDYFFGCQPF